MLDEDKTDLTEDVIEVARNEGRVKERKKWWIHNKETQEAKKREEAAGEDAL